MRLVPNHAGALWLCNAPLILLLSLTLGCAADSKQRRPRPITTIARLIDERGTMKYLARTYSAPGVVDKSSDVSGIVIMRDAADMRPIGGQYYDDGFGNLIGFGTFKAPKLGGLSRYAITFRKNGGMQLALDFRDDAVVDVLLELDRDGRLGALADPDTQEFLDCMSEQLGTGANLVVAANKCLAGLGGGGGGGLGRDAELDADRLSEPDCGDGGGLPGSVAGPSYGWFGSVTRVQLDQGYEMTIRRQETSSGQVRLDATVRDSNGDIVYQETRIINEHGEVTSRETVEHHYDADGNYVNSTVTRYERGEKIGEVTTEHDPNGLRVVIEEAEIIEEGEEESAPEPDVSPTRQPGPECEDCPVEDPRCAPAPNDIASLWDCEAGTNMSLLECIESMQNAIYGATGGRCAVEPGADDRPMLRCGDRRFNECLAAGGTVQDCFRSSRVGGGDGSVPGGEDDDFLRDPFGRSRGQVGFYIDTTPAGAVFLAICAEVEQFCGFGRQ